MDFSNAFKPNGDRVEAEDVVFAHNEARAELGGLGVIVTYYSDEKQPGGCRLCGAPDTEHHEFEPET